MFDELEKKEAIEYASACVIKIIMEDRHISCAEATKLWYNSKTKAATLDGELWFLAPTRLYAELELEESGDSMWMARPID